MKTLVINKDKDERFFAKFKIKNLKCHACRQAGKIKEKIMKEIRKKIWPEFFEEIQKGFKKVEYRMADFQANEDDLPLLEEYRWQTRQYTGRYIKKIIKKVHKIDPLKYNSPEDLEKYGPYLLELGEEHGC